MRGAKVEVPERYLLDVRNGVLTGDFAATVTPSRTLDYEVSGYFGIASWREHPLFLRPTLGQTTHVGGTILSLTTRGTSSNYYHFLYDAIARYGTFEEALDQLGDIHLDGVVVPHQARYQRQWLELLDLKVPLLQPKAGHSFVAERLLVPSTPNQDLVAPRSTTQWLRKRFPARADAEAPRRIYITRGSKPHSRRYVQEQELTPHLERRGFAVVDPGALTVQEQIDLFHGAECVVSPHGAALTNLTFCQPGVRVLEMFAPAYVHLGLWSICESIGDVQYRYLVGEGRPGRPDRMTGVLEDVSVPVPKVLEILDDLLG